MVNSLQKSSLILIIPILFILITFPPKVLSQETLTETEVVVTTVKAPDVTVTVPEPDVNPTETVTVKGPGKAKEEPTPNEPEETQKQPKQPDNKPEEPKQPTKSSGDPPKDSTQTNSQSASESVKLFTGNPVNPSSDVNVVEWNSAGFSVILGGSIVFFMVGYGWVL